MSPVSPMPRLSASSAPALHTRQWLLWLLLVLAALQLAACASLPPPRPFTTEAEALAARGEPTRRWHNDDGTTTLEYATQPNGETCLMVQVDAGGMVLRQWDALAPVNLARVQVGMDMEQIARLLGDHRSEQTFRQSGEVVRDWKIGNDGPGATTLFNVHFIDGKVVRTSRTYLDPRESRYGFWGSYGYGYGIWGGYPHGGYGAHMLFPFWYW